MSLARVLQIFSQGLGVVVGLAMTASVHADGLARLHHPAERRMAPILDPDPAIQRPPQYGLPMFRHQPLQPHQAGVP
jgi:hypothetical protein